MRDLSEIAPDFAPSDLLGVVFEDRLGVSVTVQTILDAGPVVHLESAFACLADALDWLDAQGIETEVV